MFDFNLFPVLHSENLVLRELSDNDAGEIFSMASDAEVTRYVEWDTHAALGDTYRAFLQFRSEYSQRAGIVWAIQIRRTGQLAGLIGIKELDYRNNRANVGYWLGSHHWGRGYATEALEKVISFTLHALGFERIEAKCVAENPASGRVMQKAGMTFEGVCRHGDFVKGRFWDLRIYSVLQKEVITPGVIPVSFGGPLFDSVRTIRQDVFVKEQAVPYDEEFDEQDSESEHVLAFLGGKPVGCGRFFVQDGHGVMGRIASLKEYRGNGVGAAVCRELIGLARHRGVGEITIHAQTAAEGFYEKLGFARFGETFMEAGIEHVMMRLGL